MPGRFSEYYIESLRFFDYNCVNSYFKIDKYLVILLWTNRFLIFNLLEGGVELGIN